LTSRWGFERIQRLEDGLRRTFDRERSMLFDWGGVTQTKSIGMV
jgi:hypothetical protein